MKNSGITNSISLVQGFAIKKKKNEIVWGDLACTYNRCSSLKQDSVEWQSKLTAGFVRQNNWQLIKAFGEKESAKTDDRKEFQEMLQFCKKNNISHIVFHSYDRFSRTGNLSLIDELRDQGIKVHSASQIIDDETSSGRMMQKMHLIIAQMENEQRRDKIIEGLKNKLRKGEWVTAPPMGYEKRFVSGSKEHYHDKPQCFINDIGLLLRQVFHWKDRENITNLAIIARLEKMGLALIPAHLTRIFRNPFYCGYITSTLLDEGEIIRGKHEALVSEEVFLRVNGIVNGKPHGWKQCDDNVNMTMKASVHCSKCGRLFTAYTKKDEYVYYKCPNLGCKVNISGPKLTNLFAAELSKYSISIPLLPLIKSQLEATFSMLKSSEADRVKPMKDELTRLKNELEAMEMNLAIGNLPPDLYRKHSTTHLEKICSIEGELGKLTQDSSNMNLYLDKSLNLACNLLKTWEMMDYKGKVRFQKLVFPDGLVYGPAKHTVRTPIVNPIFNAISSISSTLNVVHAKEKLKEPHQLHQVYLMFGSSNFFWEGLEETAKTVQDLLDFSINLTSTVSTMTVNCPTYDQYNLTTWVNSEPIMELPSNPNHS
ncbi:MAG: recombinase family protein [Bacteroidota bacterium]|nr:recombinase family protein [Bacteroidota bacterium]